MEMIPMPVENAESPENDVLRANIARLRYLKEEIEVAQALVGEAERSLKGFK